MSYDELVAVRGRVTSGIEDAARNQGADAGTLLRMHIGVSIDAIIAFLGVYHTRGFETRMVFWFTPI